jgi:UDP-N-acetylmuramoyl-tripeptide--D-alanyl-D-alanine ligase
MSTDALFTVSEIAAATNGRIERQPGHMQIVTNVAIDSRKACPGSLFVPLAGEKTNGHLFVGSAIAHGAAGVLVSKSEWGKLDAGTLEAIDIGHIGVVLVDDTLRALQACALFHMDKYRNATRIGITGSSGKTTTKEILGSILSKSANTMMNEGNFNSEIGLPLASFGLTGSHKYALFEMGMNHEGEMDVLADIVKPDYAIITNIGTAHIGILGSKEAIALEKKKIFKHFSGIEKGFVFEDEEFYEFLSGGVRGTIFRFGPKSTRGIEGYTDLGLDGIAIDWEGLRVRYPLFGHHNLSNALAAITVAMEIGIEKEKIKEGLESVTPLFGRSQIIKGPLTFIQDCYNANPDSVSEVLRFFDSLSWKGRKIAVLGSMLELGSESGKAHTEIAALAKELRMDAVFFYGAEYEEAFFATTGSGCTKCWKWTNNFDTLVHSVAEFARDGDIVLVKASRGMALERIASSLMGRAEAAGHS